MDVDPLDTSKAFQKIVNVSIPLSVRRNGTMFAIVVLRFKKPRSKTREPVEIVAEVPLTDYIIPKPEVFNLMSANLSQMAEESRPHTHWQPNLNVQLVTELITFDRQQFPTDVAHLFQFTSDLRGYKPILFIDNFAVLQKHMKLITKDVREMELSINFSPVSIGRVRVWTQFRRATEALQKLGFSQKDVDEVKGIFFDTNLYFLILTFVISMFHLLFDILAFKNDISFWRNRKTMVGLSPTMVLWRCFSQWVIFLYLLDEKTSLIVLIPVGVGAVIDIWKVWRISKFRILWKGSIPVIMRDQKTEMELETSQHDTQAIKYLSIVLVPLVLGGALYSLVYNTHKSWYSWIVNSLVNGVYAFGFLFMLPQLFLNYRLKTVAHLPWRSFMYKAFNTFIDDVFAFIITMPTSHRVAVFRDDVVFLVYLYQRWLYPVDKSRVNEFGETFDSATGSSTSSKEHQD
jgi:hypothetical protein